MLLQRFSEKSQVYSKLLTFLKSSSLAYALEDEADLRQVVLKAALPSAKTKYNKAYVESTSTMMSVVLRKPTACVTNAPKIGARTIEIPIETSYIDKASLSNYGSSL